MKLFNKLIPKEAVVALGNFDGVHIGHKAVLSKASELAKEKKLSSCAITFDPHPQIFFKKEKDSFLITPLKEKNKRIKETGIDTVVTLNFTKELASLSATDFIKEILLSAKYVVVGFDFVFGHNREGTLDRLKKILSQKNIPLIIVPAQKDKDGEVISSSRIRKCLTEGNIVKANKLLGRKFLIQGIIQHGDERGRHLNFPTANILLEDIIKPRYGVYAVLARKCGDNVWLPSVANFGLRPTFNGKEEIFEFHILDFNNDIYKEEWEVCLIDFIRKEQKFENIEFLKKQITKDIKIAKEILKDNNEE